jgi:hypothetical protein
MDSASRCAPCILSICRDGSFQVIHVSVGSNSRPLPCPLSGRFFAAFGNTESDSTTCAWEGAGRDKAIALCC